MRMFRVLIIGCFVLASHVLAGKHITLTLERPHWESQVWVDSEIVGAVNHLSVTHTYDLSKRLTPGEHGTIWHSDWRKAGSNYPYAIVIEMAEPMGLAGLDYTAREGNPNGRIADCRVSASTDGETWTTVHEGAAPTDRIRFAKPCTAAFIRFEALSAVDGKAYCAIAELAPVFADGATGVDEQGLIEGFNQ